MTPDEKKLALRTELLVDPATLAPGPELDPIKPYYVAIIETAISDWNAAHPEGPVAAYGGYTDQAIANDLGVIEVGTVAVRAVSADLRRPLMRGSWGAIQLLASRTPAAPAGTRSTELQMNITARNLISLLSDPAAVWLPEDYPSLQATCAALLTAGHITQQEHDDVLAVMMGRDVTRAYNKGLVDGHTETATWAEVSLALRGP